MSEALSFQPQSLFVLFVRCQAILATKLDGVSAWSYSFQLWIILRKIICLGGNILENTDFVIFRLSSGVYIDERETNRRGFSFRKKDEVFHELSQISISCETAASINRQCLALDGCFLLCSRTHSAPSRKLH